MRNLFTKSRSPSDFSETEEKRKQNLAEEYYEWAKSLVRVFVPCGYGIGYEKEELEGVALYGLAKAIANYEPGHACSFRTYASRLIYNELMEHCRSFVKKSLQTVCLEERYVDCVVGNDAFETVDSLIDDIVADSDSEEIKLGVIGLKAKIRGNKIGELEQETGIPVEKWYRCMYTAKKVLRRRLELENTV